LRPARGLPKGTHDADTRVDDDSASINSKVAGTIVTNAAIYLVFRMVLPLLLPAAERIHLTRRTHDIRPT